MDSTTQWIDSLKIHLLHPHATTNDINQWLINNNQPCAIEKYQTIEIGTYHKGVGIPLPAQASFLIDINLISNLDVTDIGLCWIVGDQIYYPHRNHPRYVDWLPTQIISAQQSPHLGAIRLCPSTQPRTVTLAYKELYLPNHLSHDLTHISTFHASRIDGSLQSCWRTNAFCPDPSELEHYPTPTSLSQSVYLIPASSETIIEDTNVASGEEFIQI
jgi:hypothetical protein